MFFMFSNYIYRIAGCIYSIKLITTVSTKNVNYTIRKMLCHSYVKLIAFLYKSYIIISYIHFTSKEWN